MKLGIEDSVANIFDRFEIKGELGHLIRQGTYLEMLPTPHNFKVTKEWLNDEIIHRYIDLPDSSATKTAVQAAEVVGGVTIGVLVARKLLKC
jgi:NADH dehydrogenase